MARALRVCSRPGCPNLCEGGRCPSCRAEAERARGSAAQRGYGHEHETRFRRGVLQRDPICIVCRQAPSSVADHWPIDRRELVRRGLDPNDPKRGRGLCDGCHGRSTAELQPGGWHAR
jgi:5-methylcytosine-specific restriction protein A